MTKSLRGVCKSQLNYESNRRSNLPIKAYSLFVKILRKYPQDDFEIKFFSCPNNVTLSSPKLLPIQRLSMAKGLKYRNHEKYYHLRSLVLQICTTREYVHFGMTAIFLSLSFRRSLSTEKSKGRH